MALGVSEMMYFKIFPYHVDKHKPFFHFKFSSCHSVSTLRGDFESLSVAAQLIKTNVPIEKATIAI